MRHWKLYSWEFKGLDDSGVVEGHASIFGVIDRQGDIVVRGAFAKRLPQFLNTGIVLFNHDPNEVVGVPLEAREDRKGLWFRAKLAATPRAQEVRELLRDGVLRQLSIGYRTFNAVKLTRENLGEYLSNESVDPSDADAAIAYGYALTDIELYDISPVSVAANPLTEITMVKNAACPRPFADECASVLGAVHELIDRTSDVIALREAKGGHISAELRARVASLTDALSELQARIDAAAVKSDSGTTLQFRARLLRARAALQRFGFDTAGGAHS